MDPLSCRSHPQAGLIPVPATAGQFLPHHSAPLVPALYMWSYCICMPTLPSGLLCSRSAQTQMFHWNQSFIPQRIYWSAKACRYRPTVSGNVHSNHQNRIRCDLGDFDQCYDRWYQMGWLKNKEKDISMDGNTFWM